MQWRYCQLSFRILFCSQRAARISTQASNAPVLHETVGIHITSILGLEQNCFFFCFTKFIQLILLNCLLILIYQAKHRNQFLPLSRFIPHKAASSGTIIDTSHCKCLDPHFLSVVLYKGQADSDCLACLLRSSMKVPSCLWPFPSLQNG